MVASILPMTLEGIILNGLIQLDVNANAALRILRNDQLPDSEWTRFNNLFSRFLYVGKKPEHEQASEDHNKMNMR